MHGLSEFLQKVLDLLLQAWPITVVDPWQTGVRVRLGNRMKTLYPGWHFVIPYIDVVYTSETNSEVFNAGKQTIDNVTFEIVGAFRLVDPTRFYVELNDDPIVAVGYAVAACAAKAMTEGGWKGATDERLRTIRRRARLMCARWGIRLEWVEFKSVVEGPSLRLLTDSAAPTVIHTGDH